MFAVFDMKSYQKGSVMWALYAFGSAVFAALTSILAKIGIDGVNSNLATAIRTAVVLVMAWGMVFIAGGQAGIPDISKKAGSSSSYRDLQQALHGSVIIKHSKSATLPKSFPSTN